MKVTSRDPDWHETHRIAVSRTTRCGRTNLHEFSAENSGESRSWWGAGIGRLEAGPIPATRYALGAGTAQRGYLRPGHAGTWRAVGAFPLRN